MQLSQKIIDHLIAALEQFHRETPLDIEHQMIYKAEDIKEIIQIFLAAFYDPEKTLAAAEYLARQMLAIHIPYVVVMGDINTLKQALINHYKNDFADPFELIKKADDVFETAKNEIARIYLQKKITENNIIPHTKLESKILISIYGEWFNQFQQAALDPDPQKFRAITEQAKYFDKALFFPESLMVCMDVNACDEVHRMHENIVHQSKLFFLKLMAKDYIHAYILYNEITLAVKQLIALLTSLYYNYETNRISSFFQFLEGVRTLDHRTFLIILNIKGLRRINQLKGEDIGDQIIAIVEEAIVHIIHKERQRMAYIRGIAGDFYLVQMSSDREQVQKIIHRIQNEVQTKHLAEYARFSAQAVLMNELPQYDRNHIRHIIQYMHKNKPQTLQIMETKEDMMTLELAVAASIQQNYNITKLLESKSVELVLQPIADLKNTHKKLAFEILGRLKTQDGLISAGIFIDTLIELELADQFDLLMLDKICEMAPYIHEITDTVFINVSPASLNNEHYVQRLVDISKHELNGLNIILELTEQTLLQRIDRIKTLSKEHGLVFAIDDFGTGYSSLITVVDLASCGAIKYLKIDGSLTKKINHSQQILNLFNILSDMASSLSIYSIAEFIENDTVIQSLISAGITYGQGYYLGRPRTIEEWLVDSVN